MAISKLRGGILNSMKSWHDRFYLPVLSIGIIGVLLFVVLTGAQSLPEPKIPEGRCHTAKACFEIANDWAKHHAQDLESHRLHFQQIRNDYPESDWGKQAGLRLGRILLETQPDQALQYLKEAESHFPLLRDYIRVWMAEALLQSGASQDAAVTFESILKEDPNTLLENEIHYGGGFAWYEAEECHRAIHHLRDAVTLDPESDDAPGALQAIADCAKQLGQNNLVDETFHELWWRYPNSPEAQTVREAIKSGDGLWKPSLGDYFQRATTYYQTAHFESAIADLRRFLDGHPGSPSREKGQFKLAMAHVRLKQYPEASIIFKLLSKGQSSYRGQATEWLARVYLRQGKGAQLIALSQSGLSGLKSNERSQIQWMCGIWYEDQGNIDKAVKAYQRAADLAGSSRTRFDALWRQGWLYYQHGNFGKAHSTLTRILRNAKDPRWVAKAQYWVGRSLANLGSNGQAQAHYRRVAHDFPMTYYGQLAQTRLLALPVGSQEASRGPIPNLQMDSTTRDLLNRDVHYQKAKELANIGFMEEAVVELLHVSQNYRTTQEALFEIGRKLGAFDQALLIARRYFRDLVERQRVPRSSALWAMAYPNGYLPIIQNYADSLVDPYLVSGIIREESLYNHEALSPVGAIGLMQLMPTTAQRVAKQIALPSFERDDLFTPEVNLRLGVKYVGQLLRKYEGKVVHVIAAYNAGPKAVERWAKKNGHRETDEFVELISYKETRRYVKRVLTSYHVYHDLYDTRCSVSSLDKEC